MSEEIKNEQAVPDPAAEPEVDTDTKNTPVPEASKDHHSHIGPILGVLIVVLVLILGGLYLWGGTISETGEMVEPQSIENNEPETVRAEADEQILNTTSSSDEIEAIEADLESTELDELDAELDEIERELEAALGGENLEVQ